MGLPSGRSSCSSTVIISSRVVPSSSCPSHSKSPRMTPVPAGSPELGRGRYGCSAGGAASAGSGNLRLLDGGGSLDDLAEFGVGGVPVPPGDVAADHACLVAVGGVVGAVEGEVAQRGELRLDPVEPGAVERRVGDLGVVHRRPG